MKGGENNMKRKNFENSLIISSIIWAIFTYLAWYAKQDLGTVATLGGIALMFAWMYEESKVKD